MPNPKPVLSQATSEALLRAQLAIEHLSSQTAPIEGDGSIGTLMAWSELGKGPIQRSANIHPIIQKSASEIADQIRSLPSEDQTDAISVLKDERQRLFESCEMMRVQKKYFTGYGNGVGQSAKNLLQEAKPAAMHVGGSALGTAAAAAAMATGLHLDGVAQGMSGFSGFLTSTVASGLGTFGVGFFTVGACLTAAMIGVSGLEAVNYLREARQRKLDLEKAGLSNVLHQESDNLRPGWEDKLSLEASPAKLPEGSHKISKGEADFQKKWTQTDVIDEILRQSGDLSIPEQSKISNGSSSYSALKALSYYAKLSYKPQQTTMLETALPQVLSSDAPQMPKTRLNMAAFDGAQPTPALHSSMAPPSPQAYKPY